jgi:predicted amidohydrolase YtcJ
LAKTNKLPIRIFEQVLVHSESEAIKNIKLFKQNNNLLEYSTLKAVADGSFGASTAAMIEHYKGDNNNFGKLNYSNENLLKIIKVSVNNNIPIAIHCIGDKATLQCCELFNKVKKTAYSNQIVHATTLNENLLRYIKKLNLQISSQPSFISDDYNMAPLKLNAKQLKYSYLFKTFFDLGINVGGSSDSPVCDNNPFVGIHAAVNRIGGDKVFMPKECLSVQQGINLYTKNAAKLVYRKNIGEIKKGYLADLIVLDKNIYKLNKMDIDKIKPILTIVNGKIIYKKG